MNEAITLLVEDANDKTQTLSCQRFAVMLQGKEVWIQLIEGQLFIGTDIAENDPEFTNLVLRPLATNLISIQLEKETAEPNANQFPEDKNDHASHSNCQCGQH